MIQLSIILDTGVERSSNKCNTTLCCEKASDVSDRRSYVERGCSDGMWCVVLVRCNGAVRMITWSLAIAPSGRESSIETMRRKR